MAVRTKNNGQIKKGEVRNPKGSTPPPKELRWATILEQELKKPLGDIATVAGYEGTLERRHTIVRKYVEELIKKGEIPDLNKFVEQRIDREDGKPQQKTDITSGGEPIIPILGGIVKAPDDD